MGDKKKAESDTRSLGRNRYDPYKMTRRELTVDIARQAAGVGPRKPSRSVLKSVKRFG